jgi:hypothetical protein
MSLIRAVTADFSGARFKIAGVEDFIAIKIFAGGPRDIEDVLGVSSERIDFTAVSRISPCYLKAFLIKLPAWKSGLSDCLMSENQPSSTP